MSFDEWEAGELGVEYDDQEPQEVLRWALETFAPERGRRLHQLPGRRHGDPRHGLAHRPRTCASSPSTPAGCRRRRYDIIDRVREHYGIDVEIYRPTRRAWRRWSAARREPLPPERCPQRLMCCDVRKVRPLVTRPAMAWTPG